MSVLHDLADLAGRARDRARLTRNRLERRVEGLRTQADSEIVLLQGKATGLSVKAKHLIANVHERVDTRLARTRSDVDAIRNRLLRE